MTTDSNTDKVFKTPNAVSSGIDVTLIDEMLAMTPEERFRLHDAALRCVIDLRAAMRVFSDDLAS